MSNHRGFSPPAVLITGAASGIGRMAALRLAREGWRCVLVDADEAALARVRGLWPSDAPTPTLLTADLTDAAQIDALGPRLPPLDALINNAGMTGGGIDVISGIGDATARRLLALNLDAPARMVRACTPVLLPDARIVNVASGAGLRAIPWRSLYSASKAGLMAQTRALARAYPGWTVCALSPGFVRTELVQRLIAQGHLDPARAIGKIPLGRMAEPEELAAALCFLVGHGARPLTGQLLIVDGGSSLYGGSEPLPAARHALLPGDAPLVPDIGSVQAATWYAVLASWAGQHADAGTPVANASHAVIDDRAMAAAPGGMLEAVLAAARQFRDKHAARASLTLLLPGEPPGPSGSQGPRDRAWQHAGDAAAARMAIATLAIEWGALGLRINALCPAPDVDPAACVPLLDYLAGPRAQFVTGQLLRPGAGPAWEAT